MQGRRGRKRARVIVAAVAAMAAIAVGCALLVDDEARSSLVPTLAVGVFGTFLTSMSIIAAFAIEKESRWPTPWEALKRAHVPAWFAVALSSVVTALLATAFDSDFMSALSLALAILGVPLATRALSGLIFVSSDQGRWRLVVQLLAESILRGDGALTGGFADLGEIDTEDHVPPSFVNQGRQRLPRRTGVSIEQVPRVLSEYADKRQLEAIVRLVDEVHEGACTALIRANSLSPYEYLPRIETLLYFQRAIYRELGSRILSGQLGEATARTALTSAGEAALDVAGRARRGEGADERIREKVERIVARHLTALARFAGHLTQEADAKLALSAGLAEEKRGGVLALRAAAVELQQAVRWAVDPEPPGMKLPDVHPWREGLGSPEAVLLWLWSTVESASGPFGVALYATCQILTGEKFWESYWDGFDVFTEISRRLEEQAKPEAVAAVEALESSGGLELVTLELGAKRLAATPPRQPGEPAFEHDPARLDDRHVACNLFLAAGGFKPPDRDPIVDLAQLLTDRPARSLWSTVINELRRLPDEVVVPSLRPLYRDPEACALAICMRLAPLEAQPDAAALDPVERFVSSLPRPLLERTARLGAGLVSGERCDGDRADLEARLVESARYPRLVTPDDLPPLKAKGAPSVLPAATVPGELADKGFGEVLEAIAAADPGSRIDLIQLDRRWLRQWAEFRAALDATVLATALRGSARVRRVILYDLPGYVWPPETRWHYRWTESLEAAVRCFPHARSKPGPYEVRQVLATRFGGVEDLPEDRVFVRSTADPENEFDALWLDRRRGLIKL
ncbi:MAG: hypothetical protein ACJ76D_06770 [Solirubrobacterales bacterium]